MFDQASLDKNIFVWWSRFLVAMCIKFHQISKSTPLNPNLWKDTHILKGALKSPILLYFSQA